jgi:uncharacterized iron-regulated protein
MPARRAALLGVLGRLAVAVLAAALLDACAMPGGAPAAPSSERAAGEPPFIYDSAAGERIGRDALVRRLASVRYRLLGEVHDNPAHHVLRAALLRALVDARVHPAVVFEQFDLSHDEALARAQAAGADAEALATAGELDRRGWRWPLHEPIVAAALDLRLPVHAGNLPGEVLDRVIREGNEGQVGAEVRAAVARAPWSQVEETALEDEIRVGHCGKLPEALVPRFALAQRLRDAAMALALVRAATADGAVLIAGNGHVRRDRGVPAYLPALSSVSVGFVEVQPGEDAASTAREARNAYDYVWVTRAVSRPDPCKALERVKGIEPSS